MEISGSTTAFITGGAQGIGLGIARALAAAGARLALADIDGTALQEAEDELREVTQVRGYQLDVRDRAAFASVADDAAADLGPVSLLVNNAGVGLGVMQSLSQEMNYATWDHVVGINLEGVNNGVQTFLPRMVAAEKGHIVNVSSAAGLVVFDERGSGYTYHASKYAVVGLSEALRRGLADESRDIGVSVVIPGMVGTNVGSNSLATAPAAAIAAESRESMRELAHRGDAALRHLGRDIDAVGEMVRHGITANQPYIFTDRLAEEALSRRTARLIAAMPAETAHDTALATAMGQR